MLYYETKATIHHEDTEVSKKVMNVMLSSNFHRFKLDNNCSVETVGDISISCNEEKEELTLFNVILKGYE